MKGYSDIERMILEHIEKLDAQIRYTASSSENLPELFKAKSMALESLVKLYKL